MQTIDQLLDRAKKAQGIESDYRLAQLLEVSKNAITNYRHGKSRPDDEVALRLAALIDRDPASVIAELHAERAKTPEVRAMWLRMANTMRHAVASVMMTCGLAMLLIAGNPTPAQASNLPSPLFAVPGSVSYVKSRMRRFGRFARSRLARLLTLLRPPRKVNERFPAGAVAAGALSYIAPCSVHPASFHPSPTC